MFWVIKWVCLLLEGLRCVLDFLCSSMEEVVDGLLKKCRLGEAVDLRVVKIGDIDQLTTKRFWLVGRLQTSKSYNMSSLKKMLLRLWQTREEVTITEWNEDNRLLISFRSHQDRRSVLRGSPWNFDNALLLLGVTDGKSDPSTIPLAFQNFWVRVRGLPPYLLNDKMGKRIGGILGTFVECNTNRSGDCTGNFLRIRVGFEISEPLHRWLMLDLGGEKDTKLLLEYEDIPYFCLFRGRLSHVCSECDLAKNGTISEPMYGRWRTLFKNIFSIEPDGNLSGQSYGFTKRRSPWKMQAPEPLTCGIVRSREDMESGGTISADGMEVDVPTDTMDEEHWTTTKRRRLPHVTAASGVETSKGKHVNLAHTTASITAPPGFGQKESHACQSLSVVGCSEDGHSICFEPSPLGGIFESVSGSILDFQRPLEGILSTVGLGATTLGKPSSTQTISPLADKPKNKRQGKKAQSLLQVNDSKPASHLPLSTLNPALPKPHLRNENLQTHISSTTTKIPTIELQQPCQAYTTTAIGALNISPPPFWGIPTILTQLT